MELTRWQRWRLLAFRLFAVRADRLKHADAPPLSAGSPRGRPQGTSNCCGTTRYAVSSAYV
jgi:hypothetical protein